MTKQFKHVRHQARKHHQNHLTLKNLVQTYNRTPEKVWGAFVTTFIVVLVSLLLIRNWGTIVELVNPDNKPKIPQISSSAGFQKGVYGVYQINSQENDKYQKLINTISTDGSRMGTEVTLAFGAERGFSLPSQDIMLRNSVWITNYLSTGQHLTRLEQGRARALQKSILSTYYLGEKSVDINQTLETDSKILSQINNTLSTDLFQYLNQSVSRADSLDNYLNLLKVLLEKTNQRIADLDAKVRFLSANFQASEQEIKISEEAFFNNLSIFSGADATDELARFVGITESQVEIRAKMGAYDTLKGYYTFFKPRLENLITTIEFNRAPLIAGVKVVEIQNMALPLIIRGQN